MWRTKVHRLITWCRSGNDVCKWCGMMQLLLTTIHLRISLIQAVSVDGSGARHELLQGRLTTAACISCPQPAISAR